MRHVVYYFAVKYEVVVIFLSKGILRGQSKMTPGYRSRKPNLHDSKTSLRHWSHSWVIMNASSQNNN
jgi:hypothetical protein